MKNFLKTKRGIACIVAVAVVILLAAAGFGGYEYWLYRQPKFHDLTVELGTDTVSIRDFMTPYAKIKKAAFVSDPGLVDLNRVGQTELTLKHGGKKETVTLTVQDTTAPTAQVTSAYTVMIDALPEAKDLVSDVQDMSRTEISFEHELVIPVDYRDATVTVVLTDDSGNEIRNDCTLSFCWMRESYALELGDTLTKADLLLNPDRDETLLNQEDLDAINASGLGTYTITSSTGAKESTCTVTVQDTRGPELELNDVQRLKGKKATLDDFVASATDVSGVAEVRLMTDLDIDTVGTYTVTIEAEDTLGNITTKEATLWITTDMVAPKISGDLSTLTVEKHSSPDFLAGITAEDKKDGACQVTCDTSKLDLDTAGTYYITYSASDTSGNVQTAKRKVIVNHDAEDTAALVKQIAEGLSNDPEELRDYVRSSINYNHNWGGDDPVWYGFTTRNGNCYVHAMCLKAIFDLKGIENQLIWVTNETHYWLLVKIGDGWKHIDPTPSVLHSKYSLMSDAQRLSTLSGRKWDTTKWPACE